MATTIPLDHTLLHILPQKIHFKLAGSSLYHRSTSPFTPGYSPTLSTCFSTPASRRLVSCSASASASEQAQKVSFSPPTSKEEAIAQARTCLANALARPLSNAAVAGKFRKQRQPRFRLEIPVFDDSPESLSRLAQEVVSRLPVKRRPPAVLLLWPTTRLFSLAAGGGDDSRSVISLNLESLSEIRPAVASADVVVFFSPASSQLSSVSEICEAFHPKPAVLFNPSWSFEQEDELRSEVRTFVKSFEVVYSFTGLEVRGVLSKKRGVVFRCVKDGAVGSAGEGWDVLMEGDGGEMKVVTRFKKRPAIGEVENVLYNVMAMNSPITKTVKFFKNLVSSSNDQDDKKKKK